MNILYVASEAAPFLKTGGLADVAGSLPLAISRVGHDIRVVMPLHEKIKDQYKKKMKKIAEFYVDLGWRRQYAGVLELEYQDTIYYFIDNEYYFKRDTPYGAFDDGERYGFFSKAVALLPKEVDFKPDVIHTNDWHCALVNLYVKDFAKGDKYYKDIKRIFTIHNLKYQGVFDSSMLKSILGISEEYFQEDGIKFYDSINYMKAGIVYSDFFTTVSGTYALEIKNEFFGEQLEGIIQKYEYKLKGIINGIDYDIYNPKIDSRIPHNYSTKTLENKKKNKKALQELYGLPKKKNTPVISMISRLVAMKGIDLIRPILDELLQEDIQFILLGTGDKEYEEMFRFFEAVYPEKVSSRIYFSEKEAHMIYAGSDMFLMPSQIEPCGISQLIALRYGTLPIVRETGGLKDTVTPYNKYTKEGNGFSFKNYNAHELLFTIKKAIALYKEDTTTWENIIINAMNAKNDWEVSAKVYIELYKELISD